jgi:spermidine/putrescine transport system substrate-binding protein
MARESTGRVIAARTPWRRGFIEGAGPHSPRLGAGSKKTWLPGAAKSVAGLLRIAAVAALVACAGSADRPAEVGAYGLTVRTADLGDRLNLFTWSDYIDPALVTEFEKTYGVRVRIDYYDTNEALIAKLQAGGQSQYDVIIASDYAVEVLRQGGQIQTLDTTLIPNRRNLDARFVDPPYDPGNRYSLTYQWGTSGLGVRSDLVDDTSRIIPSWRLVFDSAAAVGPFVMMSDARELIGAALIYLGHSANSTDSLELAEAERLLLQQRDRVLTYAPFATARDLLASGDATVAHNYSGDILTAREEVAGIRYVIPTEGAIIWTDNMAIPAGAPHAGLANVFINFILDANVGARLSDFTRYPSPNAASTPLIDADLRADPSVYPDSATMQRLEFLRDIGAARSLYDRIFTLLRAGAGG